MTEAMAVDAAEETTVLVRVPQTPKLIRLSTRPPA